MCVPPPPENGKQIGFYSIVLDNQSALNGNGKQMGFHSTVLDNPSALNGNGWGKLQFHTTKVHN